jgi:hypothetical protein
MRQSGTYQSTENISAAAGGKPRISGDCRQ